MRIASWSWGGRSHVGLISADGSEATPLAVPDAEDGALSIIRALAHGQALPAAAGPRLPVSAITLRAPLPRPQRNLFCVGRNYHAHANELAGSVFRDNAVQKDEWPIVFSKVPETVIGPFDPVRLPGKAASPRTHRVPVTGRRAR